MREKMPNIEAAQASEPMPFPYKFRGNFHGQRKGQSCRILTSRGKNTVQVEFEDGYTALVTRYVLQRRKAGANVDSVEATE
jgi:hypothetical protein